MKLQLSPCMESCVGCYIHYCPGCNQLHSINTQHKNMNNAQWTFNGNMENPTFNPSINIVGRCHYFIKQGIIEYCLDSKHKLAGQKVQLPEIPEIYL